MVIEEIIYRHSITSPEKTAVISGEVTVSYRVLWNNIKHTAAYFISKGVGKGDRIIVSASKNIDFMPILERIWQGVFVSRLIRRPM